MRLKNIAAFLMLAALPVLQSCENEVEDVFGKSAHERLTQAVEECHSTLLASQYGWKFAYEPNEKFCGRLFMKFTDNRVQIATDYLATVSSSSYGFDFSQGPVLKFDTYGNLHYLADPSLSPQGTGYGGDFEFIIMKVTADTVFLKGKKNQDIVAFCKAGPGDEENYFENGKRLKKFLLKDKESAFFNSIIFKDGTGIVFSAGKNNRYLNFYVPTAAGIKVETVSYDFDAKGFGLDKELTVGGKTVRFFDWYENDEAKSSFRTRSGDGEILFTHTTPVPLGNTVDKYGGKVLKNFSVSSSLNVILDKLKASIANLQDIRLVWNVEGKSYWNYMVTSSTGEPDNKFEIASFTKLREDQVLITQGDGSEGGAAARLKRNPNFKQLMEKLNAPDGFTVFELGNMVYFINRTNSTEWFRFSID